MTEDGKVYEALGFAFAYCALQEDAGKRVGQIKVPDLIDAWEMTRVAVPAEPDKMTDPVERARYWKLRALAAEGQVRSAKQVEPVAWQKFDAETHCWMTIHSEPFNAYEWTPLYAAPPAVQGEPVQTTKEAWWAGYRAGKGLPADTPRQEALAAPPADDEAVRLLREARNWLAVTGDKNKGPTSYAYLLARLNAFLEKR